MTVDLNKCILCSWDGDDLYRKCDLHTRIDQLVQKLSDMEHEKDAYREAGALLMVESSAAMWFQPLDLETCQKVLEKKVQQILSKGD